MVLGDIPIPGSEYEAYLGSAISRDPSPPIQSHTNTLAILTPPIAKPRPTVQEPGTIQSVIKQFNCNKKLSSATNPELISKFVATPSNYPDSRWWKTTPLSPRSANRRCRELSPGQNDIPSELDPLTPDPPAREFSAE
ncbi:hypothetical protein KQX54_004708 [Cotesia glomerata]|uniref:Uncharacterized protein n=1 Tax=Cotesia glomerata TaxID=32391 RepID=A0AAV7I079_COTGL|nr:hypothetical protein KQX54_004708 [Cotesia glomerata]